MTGLDNDTAEDGRGGLSDGDEDDDEDRGVGKDSEVEEWLKVTTV